jgi:hypothetical protein
LDFSCYDGTEVGLNSITSFNRLKIKNKVTLATYHLEGEALLWDQIFKEHTENISWESLKEALHVRFEPT